MVDVSNPAHPIPVGAAYDMNYAFEVAVSGNHAYIAAAGAGLLVADVSDPAHPVEVGTLDTPGYAYGVTGDREGRPYVYVAGVQAGLRVVDVSAPMHPHEAGACEVHGLARRVAVSRRRACVSDLCTGLRAMDVSSPIHSTQVARWPQTCTSTRGHLAHRAHLAQQPQGVQAGPLLVIGGRVSRLGAKWEIKDR